MQNKVKILAFSGSSRTASWNTKLLKVAASMAEQAGAEVSIIDLADYPMPIYNADLEQQQGLPAACVQLKQLMRAQDGFLVACPEYNGSITPLLLNTLDWVSRTPEGEQPGLCYRGKTVALVGTSPGALGALRGLNHVRDIFSNLGSLVIAEKFALPHAPKAFDSQGLLSDATQSERLNIVCQRLVQVSQALINS